MVKFQNSRNICIPSYKKKKIFHTETTNVPNIITFMAETHKRGKLEERVNYLTAKYFSPLIKRIPLRLYLNCEYPLTYLYEFTTRT